MKTTPKQPSKWEGDTSIAKSGDKTVMSKRNGKDKQYTHIYGIDTGVNTGIAVYSRVDNALIVVKTLAIHSVLFALRKSWRGGYKDKIFIRVEDARLATFGRGGKMDAAKAQGAGSVKRDAKILEDFLTDYGFHFEMVRPAMRKNKITSPEFKKITGWDKATNQHGRDAAMLCYKY